MASSSSSSSSHHVRSASYPPKKNPAIHKIEQQLKKLRETEDSSTSPLQTISIALIGLTNLYKCVDQSLNYLPLSHHNSNTHIEHLVNGSSNLLEVLSESKDIIAKLREAVRNPLEVSGYFCTRREIVKSSRGLALRLRQVEEELMLENRELSMEESEMVRVFRCVSIINISVMESLMQLLSTKTMARSSRFSLLSKLRGGRSCKEGNEVSDVDVGLHGDGGERMVIVLKRMEEGLREIESGLSCISSQLAQTRASLVKHSFLH